MLNSTISDHYDTNLNELLPYLSYEIPSSSFVIGTNGQGIDTVYGLALQKTGPIVVFAKKKWHYRYPIVAFSIKATIGISIVVFGVSYSGVLKNGSIVAFPTAYSGILKTPL